MVFPADGQAPVVLGVLLSQTSDCAPQVKLQSWSQWIRPIRISGPLLILNYYHAPGDDAVTETQVQVPCDLIFWVRGLSGVKPAKEPGVIVCVTPVTDPLVSELSWQQQTGQIDGGTRKQFGSVDHCST